MKLREAIASLKKAGVPDPEYDARELFMRVGGMRRDELLSLDAESDDKRLADAVRRRCAREPLQYIIGEVGFYRELYRVTPDCLIPRQDTEHLVDLAVRMIPEGKSFLDLCTGSGCIAISVLKNTKNTTATATDISDGALSLASENARLNGVCDRIEFKKADALGERIDGSFFAVLSNPPYVTESAYRELEEEIYFEPKAAFVAEDDGMIFYKRILSAYKDSLEEGGFFAFEIGYDQEEKIKAAAKGVCLGCEILRDYSGNARVALIK